MTDADHGKGMSILDKYMDKTELAIAGISDADIIKYYTMPDGTAGLLVIKGILVFNMSAGEPYYDSLEQAAARAYISCPEAAADDYTREIMKKRTAAEISPVPLQYEGTEGTYVKSLPFEKDTAGTFQCMMEYYLRMIYEQLGLEAEAFSLLKGYRSKYTLSFRLNGERKTVPFSYSERGSCFEMVFGNIISPTDSIKLSVKYSFGEITVTSLVKCGRHMRIENVFDIIHKTERLRIFDEAEIVYDGRKELALSEETDNGDIEIISTGGRYEMIRLPFGNAYCCETENKTEIIVVQNDTGGQTVFLYHSGREYPANDKSVVTDSFNTVHEQYVSDGKKNICTHFLPADSFSRGIYKQKYENMYFYRSIGGK